MKHLTRDVTYPRNAPTRAGASRKTRKAPTLDPAEMTAGITQVLHRNYAHWADEPVHLLDNKTPHEAMKTLTGLAGLGAARGALNDLDRLPHCRGPRIAHSREPIAGPRIVLGLAPVLGTTM